MLATQTEKPLARLRFEEGAGLVLVDILQEAGRVAGAELTAPQAFSKLSQVSAEQAAGCGSLSAADISGTLPDRGRTMEIWKAEGREPAPARQPPPPGRRCRRS